MDFEYLLNNYLDGSLDEHGEHSLFQAMAAEPDLRREFIEAVQLQEALRKNAASTIVSSALTNKVFDSLGYGSPIIPAPIPVPASLLSTATNAVRSTLPWLGSAVAGGLIVWTSIFFNLLPGRQDSTDSESLSNISTAHSPFSSKEQKGFSAAQKTDQKEPASMAIAAIPTKVIYKTIYREIQSELTPAPSQYQSTATEIPQHITAIQTIQQPADRQAFSQVHQQDKQAIYHKNGDQQSIESDLQPNNPDILFSIRSLQKPQNNVPVSTNDAVGLNNLSASIHMRVYDNFYAGIEAGREPFLQQYSRSGNGFTENITQNPTLWWAGISGFYRSPELILPGLQLFGQAMGGLAESGSIMRIASGIQWSPGGPVSVFAGTEYSSLWYKAAGNQYTSQHLGWNYGIQIAF